MTPMRYLILLLLLLISLPATSAEIEAEAKAEIEQFKAERERNYKTLEQQQLGNRTQMTEQSNRETQIQIAALKNQYEGNKQELLQRIITLVCDIKPEAHVNARIE